MAKNALVYARESRDDYGEKYERIETQRDILLEFCKKNGITNIVEVIMDDNVSGTSFERLNDVKKMMANGDIDVFICKDASRLGRNLLESLKFIEFAEECNVEIMFESEVFDPEIFPLIAWFNERRAKDDSVKIRRVLRHKLENGLVIIPPYGYKKENGVMIPDPKTAHIVKEIFEMAYDGSTPSQISDHLNIIHALSPSEGHSTYSQERANAIWTRDKVRRILTNPSYIGTQVAGKKEKVSYKSKKYRNVPEDKQIIIPNHHEALVDAEIFNQIQSSLKFFTIKSRKPTQNPLSGMMFCGRCGKRIIVRSHKNSMPVKYVCAKYNLEGNIKDNLRPDWGCRPHAAYYDDIKNMIMEYLTQFLCNDDFKKEIMDVISVDKRWKKIQTTIKSLCEDKTKLEKKLGIMYEDRLSELISADVFKQKSKQLTAEIAQLDSRIKMLENSKESDSGCLSDKYEQYISQMKQSGLTHETIKKLFKKIIVYEPQEITNDIKLKYDISDEYYGKLYNQGGYLFIQIEPWNVAVYVKEQS